MQAGDQLKFLPETNSPRVEALTDEEIKQASECFTGIKKMLVGLVRPNTGIAREFPFLDGTITVGETAFAIEYEDGSYLWISYGGVTMSVDLQLTSVHLTVEEHDRDDVVLKRHHFLCKEDGVVLMYSQEGLRVTTDRFCLADQVKYKAYYLAHPDEAKDPEELNNMIDNIEFASSMGMAGSLLTCKS